MDVDNRKKGCIPEEDLADLPRVYMNGFQISLGNADIKVAMRLDQVPVQVLHLSFTMAKSLRNKLSDMLTTLEQGVGRDILTTADIDTAFAALKEKESGPGALRPREE